MPDSPVLLVEDDDSIALIVETILSTLDRSVLRAASTSEALALAANTMPGLLITDLNLPGSSGAELALRLRDTSPALPVILISGDFDDSSSRDDLVPGAVILPKPFRRAALLEAITTAEASKG
ncbi:response regulator [Asaia sp. VD9]|uniref:response regulator n=1 Tax=Asaia sp. VD9 TaxID=3081235 RepID=UPI003019B2A5